ncbi:phospholipid-translocating ATPase rsb1 [Friedmanniomyces endolithicus]|uniref:Phospholipid-translocating ATPase rsb1 n=1 Tax=Friedmanniomyces endolithicus TaxID=329885 RepID=A0AAN6KAK7_9PEZI|nr:phospholipid-translocating ATPase rsb1 [Friedmanniomyces endolithicus]KAK0785054.1 phospholipid-translocating ATPase rsb1 [Friedmanniomyces endolithicus]KAK0789176.1 phospholipid-translocating ATPase rsb1 [Friedmanniomyces endolithicus]KAK0795748.1 phospholipid-translocating ATPase rsb1 [Friedmanniomyces endolithicus]KAK0839240.1 phospholipid-translocating ATPase rsb1 [Friedmanniomyces endolithicus]
MAIDPYAGCNELIDQSLCTFETCCLAQSHFLYLPNYGANMFFCIFFAIMILPQIGLGIYYKTWGFMVSMILGLLLELFGYESRVQINLNPWGANPFLLYLICLTIAPVFIAAAIYLCLTRVLVLYGKDISRFAPRTVALSFMFSDFLSLVFQAAGGAIADTANTPSATQTGANIMIVGLVLQAVSLGTFLIFCADYAWRCSKSVLNDDPEAVRTRGRMLFKVSMGGLLFATMTILIRSIFRAAELSGGFHGTLWNNETDFLILDGAMIALAVICLTALHPGAAFGGQWNAANWSFRKAKTVAEVKAEKPASSSAWYSPSGMWGKMRGSKA